MTPSDPLDRLTLVPVPHVLDIDQLAALLGISRRGIERLRQHHAFPIPELDLPLDSRPRWLGETVIRALRHGAELGIRKSRKPAKTLRVVHGGQSTRRVG